MSCATNVATTADELPSEDELVASGDGLVFLTRTPDFTQVLKFSCGDANTPSTVADVLRTCRDVSGGAGVPLDTYLTRLRSAYLWRVGDGGGTLSLQEELALRNLRRQIVGDEKLEAGPRGDRVALGKIAARFYDVMDVAYRDALPTAAAAGSAGPRGTNTERSALADVSAGDVTPRGAAAGEARIGTGSFRSRNVAGNLTLNIALTQPATNYGALRVELAGATTGEGCRLVQSVEAVATGLTPATAGALLWTLTPPGKLTQVKLRVRQRASTTAETCSVAAYAVLTTPPPRPDPAAEARATTLMQGLMGTADHRMWHFLWHGIRNAWDRLTPAQQGQVVTAFGDSWKRTATDENVGEEFLHMHRVMLGMLTTQATTSNLPLFPTGTQGENRAIYSDVWTSPGKYEPAAGAPKLFPFPDGSTAAKPELTRLDAEAKSPQSLALPLGAYGALLERGVHNNMHMYWADTRDGGAGPGGNWLSPSGVEQLKTPPAAWTNVTNNYLGSTYTAHVHPIFWRLHGYVDNRINDWLRANNYTRIADASDATCTQASKCYTWKRAWDGLKPAHAQHAMSLGTAFSTLDASTRRTISDNSSMSPE